MNAKILILALCAFQLTAGGIIDSFISGPLAIASAPINAFLGAVQGQAASVQQQFQNLFQTFSQNMSSEVDFGLSQFLQNFGFLNDSSQTNACMNNMTQQYYSIGNQSVALFNASVSIVNETIRNSSKILINAASSLGNAIPQAISNFTTCVSNSNSGGFFFSSLFAAPTCGAKVATQQFAAFANTTNTQIQRAQQIFSQLLSPSNINSTVHTLPQMADLGANLTLSVAAQLAAAGQQALACMMQTANSTFAGFIG